MRISTTMLALAIVLSAAASAQTSHLANGGFEAPIVAPWALATAGSGAGTLTADTAVKYSGAASARIAVTGPAGAPGDLYLLHGGLSLYEGNRYTVTFRARAARSRTATVIVQREVTPFENGGLQQTINLTTTWQTYTMAFTASQTMPSARVAWQIGHDVNTVWLDDAVFTVKVFAAIDTGQKWQEIIGWGASQAYFAKDFKAIPVAKRDSLLDLLFTDQGAGLSLVRLQVEPKWDYTSWHDTVDADQHWLIQEAQERGVERFLATPWTPPAKYKANGKTAPGVNNDPLNYLIPDSAAAYAAYLSRYLRGYDSARGVTIGWLSLQNEPDYNPKYNSCIYSPAQLTTFMRTLGPRMASDSVAVTLLASESVGWNKTYEYYLNMLGDSIAGPYLGGVATHAYSLNDQRPLVATSAIHNGKQIWQTEWADLAAAQKNDSLSNGLTWAERIHTDLVDGNTNAWLYWLLVSFGSDSNEGLIRQDGGHAQPVTYTIPKRLWTMGHYSRFTKPGAVRVNVDIPNGQVKLTAFLTPSHDTLVIVAVNNHAADNAIGLALPRKWGETRSILWHRTSPAGDMVAGTPLPATNDSLNTVLPAYSVTTYRLPLNGNPTEQGAPYADQIRPLAASASGAGNTVSYDSLQAVYTLRVGAGGLEYRVAVGAGSDAERGVLTVTTNSNNLAPLHRAGFCRRDDSGAIVLPWTAADSTTVLAFTHAKDTVGVTLSYTERYKGLETVKRYRLELQGNALRVHMRGDSTKLAAAANYAGMYPGTILSPTATSFKALQIPGHEPMPITRVGATRFLLTALDFTQSSATSVRTANMQALPGKLLIPTGVAPGLALTDTTFVNAWRTEYAADDQGQLPNVPNEALWTVLGGDVTECFMKSTAAPSAARALLDDKCIATLFTGGDSLQWWERNRRWFDSMANYGIEGIAGYLFNWGYYGFNINEPTYAPGNPYGGSLQQFDAMMDAAGDNDYRAGLFTTFWIMDQGYDTTVYVPDPQNPGQTDTIVKSLPNPNYVESDCNRAADGSFKAAWNTANNVPWGHPTRVLASTMSIPHIDRELGWAQAHGATMLYQDVVGAWLPHDEYLDQEALSGRPRTLRQGIAEYKKQWAYQKSIVDGPLISEGSFADFGIGMDSWNGGHLDGVQRSFNSGYAYNDTLRFTANYLVIPDFELRCVVPTQAGQGGANLKGKFFDTTLTFPLSDAKIDHLRAHTIAFGHAASIPTNGDVSDSGNFMRRADQVKECYMVSECLQERYLGATIDSIAYVDGGVYRNLTGALLAGTNLYRPRLFLHWTSGLSVWVNFAETDWTVLTTKGTFTLPKHGWVAVEGNFLEFSAIVNARRVDYVDCPNSFELLDGRGRSTTYGGLSSKYLTVVKADGRTIAEDSTGSLTVTVPPAPRAGIATPGMAGAKGPAIAFGGASRIVLNLPAPAQAAFSVYDAAGRVVATLAAERYAAGNHEVHLEDLGPLPSGVYLVCAEVREADGRSIRLTRPFVLVR